MQAEIRLALILTSGMMVGPVESSVEISSANLEAKAAHFERIIRERHVKNGFVRELALKVPGKPEKGGILHHSDNDGLWTGLYVAAMSFKYGATRSPHARTWARESLQALQWLERITEISGFPARSIVEAGEPSRFRYDGEWHREPSGKWEWKGDTSSDELDGHFLAHSVYYDLVADESEKQGIATTVARIMDHVIEHDWYLTDVDGKPTRWGVWNPRQLNENRPVHGLKDEDWRPERGLNSLEILSHLKVAYHITGNQKYQEKYLALIERHHYADNLLPGVIDLEKNSRSDIQLAFISYYPLLRHETDPKLLKTYAQSLENTWKKVRQERSPLWNLIYCVFGRKDCGLEDALRTLGELPQEQINWRKQNSSRKDIRVSSQTRDSGELLSVEVLPYDQISIQRWNGDPFLLDSGGQGGIEGDGVIFLLPYWIGRHHGKIKDNPKE